MTEATEATEVTPGRGRRIGRMAVALASAAVYLALGAVTLLMTAATGPALLGHRTFVVTGGSMEPSIHVGSMVVLRPVPVGGPQVGDAITYVTRGNAVTTHRVVELVEDELGPGFRTRGDANAAPDPEPVRAVNVIGRVWYSVPFAGYVVHAAHLPATRLALMALALPMLVGPLFRRSPAPVSAAPVTDGAPA